MFAHFDEKTIQVVIEYIWDTYDSNRDGYLDREEVKQFILQTMVTSDVATDFTEEAFDKVYSEIDSNRTGIIDKSKMECFIRQHLNTTPVLVQGIID